MPFTQDSFKRLKPGLYSTYIYFNRRILIQNLTCASFKDRRQTLGLHSLPSVQHSRKGMDLFLVIHKGSYINVSVIFWQFHPVYPILFPPCISWFPIDGSVMNYLNWMLMCTLIIHHYFVRTLFQHNRHQDYIYK